MTRLTNMPVGGVDYGSSLACLGCLVSEYPKYLLLAVAHTHCFCPQATAEDECTVRAMFEAVGTIYTVSAAL